MNNEKGNEALTTGNNLDMMELIQVLWKNKWIIFAFAAVAIIFSFVKVTYFTQDRYTANGILYVSNKSTDTDMEISKITQSDINSSRTLGTTYIEVLKTRSFLTDVGLMAYRGNQTLKERTSKRYTYGEIRRMLSVTAINETELLNISITAASPDDANILVQEILDLAPEKLTGIFKSGEVEIVDNPVKPTAPVNKGGTRKMLTSAFVGIVVGAALVFVLNFFDTKVRKSEDVAKRYNVSVLGEISR